MKMFHVKHFGCIIEKFVGVDVPRQGELRLRKRGCPGVRPADRRSEMFFQKGGMRNGGK